ncbi:MAG: tripartite tricarboxylate transporter substrate-binding protein, partial [Tardiphaga sp.]
NAISIAPAIFPNLNYDTSRDLASVLMIGYSANVMIVPNERPWKTVQDFLAAARAKGTVINYGSVGVGSAVHITSEKFRVAAGFEASHIPYRGGSEVITDIIGGRIDFYFCPLATALPLIREGQVRALVVSTPTRVRDLPEVPTPIEAGLKDADSAIWFGVFVPAKTPPEIIAKLYATGSKVLNTAEMQASLKKLGVEPMPMTSAELDALLVKEIAANKLLLKSEAGK